MGAIQLASLPGGTIVNNANDLQAGASVFVYEHGTVPPLSTEIPVYTDETLANELVQPLLSDAFGVVPGWCSTPQTVDIVASYGASFESTVTTQLITAGDVIAAEGGVVSFDGRTGVVVPASGDYTAAQVTGAASKTSGGQQAFAGEVAAPDFAPTGLSGLIGARFVGGTASGAPTSGTFQVRDFIVDSAGHAFICTTAGTPGTWTNAAGTGSSAVSSFNTRTGAVSPASGDYTAAQVTNAADKSSSSTQAFTGATSATAVSATGINSLSTLRLVGSTASGAPSTGTFVADDVVMDLTGKWWLCTAGGTPGTWVTVGSGSHRDSHIVAMDDQTSPSQPSGSVLGSIPVALSSGQTLKLVGAYIKCTTVGGTPSVFKVQCDHGAQGTLSDVTGLTALTPATGAYALTTRTGGSLALSEGDEVAVVLVTPGGSAGCKIALIMEITP